MGQDVAFEIFEGLPGCGGFVVVFFVGFGVDEIIVLGRLRIPEVSVSLQGLVKTFFGLSNQLFNILSSLLSPLSSLLSTCLRGLEQKRLATKMEAFRDAPGVPAVFVGGREELGLSGFFVGGDAGIEGELEVFERGFWLAQEQMQPGALQEQVDVVDAVPAVAGDFEALGQGFLCRDQGPLSPGFVHLLPGRAGTLPAQTRMALFRGRQGAGAPGWGS